MFYSVLIRYYCRKYFRHYFLLIILKIPPPPPPKKKKKTTGRWYARNTHLRKQVVLSRIFKRMVPVDYSYQSKKKYQKPFSFTCSVTTLPVFYRKRLTLRTSLSTWSHRFTSRDLYLRCRSLASRTKCSFYFCLPEINGSDSKLSLL